MLSPPLHDPADPAAGNLGWLLSQVRCNMTRRMEHDLQQHGIPMRFTTYLLLKHLALDGPSLAGVLAQSIDLDAGAMTRQLDQLETKGWLRRTPNAQDRRALRIELTDQGLEISRQARAVCDKVIDQARAALKPDEFDQLNDYLRRMREALKSVPV